MTPTELRLPNNMTRNIVLLNSGILDFAFYKDGMFRLQGTEDWFLPFHIKQWMSIEDLKSTLSIR